MTKRKKKRVRIKKLPIFIFVVLVIILIVFFVTHTSKYLFYKNLDKSLNNYYDFYLDIEEKYTPFSSSDNYLIETDSSMKYDNKLTKYKGNLYFSNNDNYISLNINKDNQDYNLDILSKDKKLYFKADKTYYYQDYYSVNLDDYKSLLELYIKKIKINTYKNDFSKSKETIEYNNKKYKTKKITLSINEEEYYNINIDYLESIINDRSLLEVYSNMKDINKDQIKLLIDSYKNKLKSSDKSKIVYKYSIYLYKGKPILNEFDNIDSKYEIFKYKDYVSFKYIEDNSESYITLNSGEISLFLDGLFYGKGKYTDNEINLNLTDYNKSNIGSFYYKITPKGKNYSNSININIDLDSLKLDISSKNKIELDKEIPKVDISKAKSMSEITDNDKKLLGTILNN